MSKMLMAIALVGWLFFLWSMTPDKTNMTPSKSIEGTNLMKKLSDKKDDRQCMKDIYEIFESSSWEHTDLSKLDTVLEKLTQKVITTADPKHSREGGSFDRGMNIERLIYHTIAQSPCIETICEIGFNMGHSALLWLTANKNARVIMFDLWEHPYAEIGLSFIRSNDNLNASSDSRLTVIKGPSEKTVPTFHALNPNIKCDLLSVDGDHRFKGATQDIENMMRLANRNFNVLLVDDTSCISTFCVDAAIVEHKLRGNIKEIEAISLKEQMRGVSVFQYIRPH